MYPYPYPPPGYVPYPPASGKPSKGAAVAPGAAWYPALGAAPKTPKKSDEDRVATLTAHLLPYDGFMKPAYSGAQLRDRYQLLIRDYVIRQREPDAKVWRRLYVTLYKRDSTHLPFLNQAYAAVLDADLALLLPHARIREVFDAAGRDVARTIDMAASMHSNPGNDRWHRKRLVDYVAYCLCGDPSGWLTLNAAATSMGDAPIGSVPKKEEVREQVMEYVTTKEDIEDRADAAFIKEKDVASVVARLLRGAQMESRDVDRLLAWAWNRTQSSPSLSGDGRHRNAADAFDADVSEVPEDIKGVTKGQFADLLNDDHRYVPFASLHPLQQTAVMVAYSTGVAEDEQSRKFRKIAFATSTQLARELLLYVMRSNDFEDQLSALSKMYERIEKITADGVVKESKAAGTLNENTKRGRVFNERFVQGYLEHAKLVIYVRLNAIAVFMKMRATMGSQLVSHEQLSGLVSELLLILNKIS